MRLQSSYFHLIGLVTMFACLSPGVAQIQHDSTQQIEFKLVYDACGSKACSHAYEASDGVKVGFDAERFQSSSLAARALNKHLKPAVEIIQRSPKLNDLGEVVGERVVARFKAARVVKAHGGPAFLTTVLWTYGADLYIVIPSEMKYATELERRLTRGPRGWLELKK